MCGDLSGTERLQAILGVVERSIQFPAQTVVQRQIGFDLPAILREQVESRIANILALGGALEIGVGNAEEVIGIGVAVAHVIRSGGIGIGNEGELAVHVEIEKLIELVAAYIHAELQGVRANGLGEIVRPLERIADLRKFAFPVIADLKAAADADVWQTDVAGKVGGDALPGIAGAGKTIGRGNCGAAGVLHALQRVDGMVEAALAFAEVAEVEFIDGGRT